jgi:hypothetical protein
MEKCGKDEKEFRHRLATILSEICPSLTITSVTNAIGTGAGIFSSTPEIRLFCTATTIAVLLDFVYQFTFFTPILIMVAKRQEQNLDPTPEMNTHKNVETFIAKAKDVYKYIVEKYCRLLCDWRATILVIAFLIGYWYVCAVHVINMPVNMNTGDFFLPSLRDTPDVSYKFPFHPMQLCLG